MPAQLAFLYFLFGGMRGASILRTIAALAVQMMLGLQD